MSCKDLPTHGLASDFQLQITTPFSSLLRWPPLRRCQGVTESGDDALLISQARCSAGRTVVAAFDAGTAAGSHVSAGGDPIPALSCGAFVLLLTAIGARLLAGRRA